MLEIINNVIFALCGVMAFGIAAMVCQGYQKTGSRLLMATALCFTGIASFLVLAFIDNMFLKDANYSLAIAIIRLLSYSSLLIGLIWWGEE